MMTRQSMARVSSASMEADYVPGMVPFDWEVASGRPARQSIMPEFYANAVTKREVEIQVEMPPLQLPPGQRPKDGFYLPYSRPVEYPNLQKEPGGILFQARNFFNVKFPGLSSKKTLFRSRMRSPFESSSQPPMILEDSHVSCVSSIFNPLSGHRFGSRITRRMFLEFQKKQSSLKRCLPSKPWSEDQRKAISSHDDPHRGRRLDSVDEDYVTAANLSASEASTPPSPGHARNSPPVAKKQLPVPESSRFMASMLISLCPGDSDEAEGDVTDGISDDYSDENSITHLMRPRAMNSSPDARFQTSQKSFECLDIARDPASPTLTSHAEFTHPAQIYAKEDTSFSEATHKKEMARCMGKSLNEKLVMAGSSEKFDALPRSYGIEEYAKKSDQIIITGNEDNADACRAFSDAVSDKESMRTRESCKSSFSWKSCRTRSRQNQDPSADLVTSNAQEPVDSEEGKNFSDFERKFKKIFEETVEEYERRGSNNSVARNLSTRSSCEFLWPRHNSLSTSIGKDAKSVLPSESGVVLSMVGYLSPPRSSCGDSEYSFDTSSSDKPGKGFARWRSRDPFLLRKTSLQERLELNQPPASKLNSSDLHRLPSTTLRVISIRGSKFKAPTSTSAWMEALTPSSLWPATPEIPIGTPHASAGNDDTDESDEDSESSSTNSSDYETPRAVWHPPSLSTPAPHNFPSTKPAKWIVPAEPLKSSLLLHTTLRRQLNHESPPSSSFMMDQESPTSRSPSFQRVMARSHSVRTRINTSREIFVAQTAFPKISVDVNAKGPDLAPPSRLSETNSNVMSKVAQWEARAGVGSSGKPLPKLYFQVQEARTITSKHVSR